MKKNEIRNLVFRGGGILGIAYLGALKVLDQQGVLPNIKRVSGASAGAITAMVTAMCKDADEIKKFADSLKFDHVPDKRDDDASEKEHKLIGAMFDDTACVVRLIRKYGWFTTDYFYGWLKKAIIKKFDDVEEIPEHLKYKDGLQTFQDFRDAGYKDLYISVTNISKHSNEIFSIETTPQMPVADAVRKSMSIPLYFETVEMDGDYYADGGTVNNYPMEVFDKATMVENPINFDDGINMETIGCHLYTSKESEYRKEEDKKKQKDNIAVYIENLFLTLLQTQMIQFNKTPNLIKRSAHIDDLGISAVDFDIKADKKDPMRETKKPSDYDKLYRSGFYSMEDFLKVFE